VNPQTPRLVLPEPDPAVFAAATELASHARLPAAVSNVRFGTAGWTDKTLIASGLFYPKGVSSAEARLRHYATHFDLVEVDATYYSLLPPEVAARWIEFTPASFRFDVKAHPILTGHSVDSERLPKDLRDALAARGLTGRLPHKRVPDEIAREIAARFRAFLAPLGAAGRLGALMLQFPPWFTATRGNARYLEALRENWPDVPLSVELRNKSWLLPERRQRVFDLLRAHAMAYVVVDEPDVERGGVPPVEAVTEDSLSLVRFHGQNHSGWSKPGASVHERFDYLYSADELRVWVAPVRRLAERAERVHALFNNCVRNYAVLGAKGLSVLLEADATAPPPPA